MQTQQIQQEYIFCIEDTGQFFYIEENYPENYKGTRAYIVKYGHDATQCFFGNKGSACIWDKKEVLILY